METIHLFAKDVKEIGLHTDHIINIVILKRYKLITIITTTDSKGGFKVTGTYLTT